MAGLERICYCMSDSGEVGGEVSTIPQDFVFRDRQTASLTKWEPLSGLDNRRGIPHRGMISVFVT